MTGPDSFESPELWASAGAAPSAPPSDPPRQTASINDVEREARFIDSVAELERPGHHEGPAGDGLSAGHGRLEPPPLQGGHDRGVEGRVDAASHLDVGHLPVGVDGEAGLEL